MIKPSYIFIIFLISAGITLAGFQWFLTYYQTRFPFNTYVGDVLVENKTYEESEDYLRKTLPPLESIPVILSGDGVELASSSAELELHYDLTSALDIATNNYQQLALHQKLFYLAQRLSTKIDTPVTTKFEVEKETAFIEEFSRKVDVAGVQPQATLRYNNSPASLSIVAGQYGRQLQRSETQELLRTNTANKQFITEAYIASTAAVLSTEQLEAARQRALKFIGYTQVFEYDTTRIRLIDVDMVSMLSLPTGYNQEVIQSKLDVWKNIVERPPQNAVFDYDKNTLQVHAFQPPKEGLTLDIPTLQQEVEHVLASIETDVSEKPTKVRPPINLPVATTQPEITLTKSNNLGIQERIGVGESSYKGSIPSRIHNVSLAASKIANFIVKPGEEFSFNNALGDVSATSGFQSAYVIMGGRTVLGDGGGVCQVSTTLFRALLNGGLDITRRLPHSYRVGYYEQNSVPGIDATVYSGGVDLRFKNDTPGHVLIHTVADSKNQYMMVELYGTSDGRSAEITDIKQWDAQPAPAPEYYPDPTLQPGQLKQIDWAVGGLKTSFRHIVKDKDGAIIMDDTYTSNYRPWSAKYLQGV